jgi:hypothetical protein
MVVDKSKKSEEKIGRELSECSNLMHMKTINIEVIIVKAFVALFVHSCLRNRWDYDCRDNRCGFVWNTGECKYII